MRAEREGRDCRRMRHCLRENGQEEEQEAETGSAGPESRTGDRPGGGWPMSPQHHPRATMFGHRLEVKLGGKRGGGGGGEVLINGCLKRGRRAKMQKQKQKGALLVEVRHKSITTAKRKPRGRSSIKSVG